MFFALLFDIFFVQFSRCIFSLRSSEKLKVKSFGRTSPLPIFLFFLLSLSSAIVWIRDSLDFLCETSVFLYASNKKIQNIRIWWAQVDSNHRPHAYQACALTTWAMSPCLSEVFLSLSPWWRWTGSNRWPPACKAGALPAELHPHIILKVRTLKIKQRL